MSIQDERELRGLLGELLDAVEAAPAPVVRTIRRGKVIRMRRWVSATAGIVVLAAGAVGLAALIPGHRAAAPLSSRHYRVTVQTLGPTAKGGVIGVGTINNKHWKIVLDNTYGSGCAVTQYILTCGWKETHQVGPREVNIGATAEGKTQFEYGVVGTDVTRVVIRLSNGTELHLRPVSAAGYNWVAVAAPVHAMVEAEAFVGANEYSRAIPYVGANYSEFVTWLRPGQPGLPKDARQIGSGEIDGVKWHVSVAAGPWGYCVEFFGGGSCTPTATSLQPPRIGKPLFVSATCLGNSQRQIPASSGVAWVPRGVKNVVLMFADGSRLRFVATRAGGVRVIGYAIPNRPKVVRTLEYGFKGQLLAAMSWADWGCRAG